MIGRALAVLLVVAVASGGCFGDDPLVSPGVVAVPASGVSVGDTSGETADGAAETETTTPTVLPNACDGATPCGGDKTCQTGVCVADPPGTAEGKVTNTDNVSTADGPDLSCVGQAPMTPAGPAAVTLYGAVARFGNGLKTIDVEVSVFAADTFDPSVCESEPTASAVRDCYQNYGSGGIGVPPIGTAISTSSNIDESILPTSCKKLLGDEADHSLCPLSYRCIEEDLDWLCLEQYGVYEIANIPTNTPLVIRSRATTNLSKWHDSYTFNVYLHADQAKAGDRIQYDATMVSEGQWQLTPNTVGLPPVDDDNGVIGGRVRDCHSAARDSWPISEVSLDLANPGKQVVFFNNLEDDTVPQPSRESSNILGRFAALDIPAGWNRLGGSVRTPSGVVTLGAVDVYVFPDSLSLVTFPGLQPYWPQDLP